MRYAICSQCRTLFAYHKLICPECETRHNKETIERIKLCRYDGTPMSVHCRYCPSCGWDMGGFSIPLWTWPLLLILFSLAYTWFLINLHSAVSHTFRPASCIIHSATINTNTNNQNTTYTISWNYTVLGKQGQAIKNGQGSMGLEDTYDSQDQAQQVVQSYQQAKAQACWYSSNALFNRALLTHPGEATPAVFLLLWLLIPLLIFSLIGACIAWLFSLWRLLTYGKSAVATVIEKEVEASRYGVNVFCTLSFKTKTTPALTFRKRLQLDLRKKQHVEIIYDPLYPYTTARLGAAPTWAELRLRLLWGALAIVLLLCIQGGLVVTAFIF